MLAEAVVAFEEAEERGQAAMVALSTAEGRMRELAELIRRAQAHHRGTRGELAEAAAILARYQEQHGQASPQEEEGREETVDLGEAERRLQEFLVDVARATPRSIAVPIVAHYRQRHGQAPAASPQEEEGREETVGDIFY